MKIRVVVSTLALLSLALIPRPCQAQWLTQRITLVPGWNAVNIEVQPEPRECDEVFKDLPVESVWKWDRRFTTIQFDLDPSSLLPENPDWQMWLPKSNPRAFLRRLTDLLGSQAYLIKVSSNAAPFTVTIKGRVTVPRRSWYPHSLNLFGFPVNPKNPPNFTEFFKFTGEVDISRGYANELYRIDPSGRGVRIVQPARDRMQRGAAYWVACARAPEGVSVIDFKPSGSGIDFGSFLNEATIFIRNIHPTNGGTVRVRQIQSESAPVTGGYPEVAGAVPLSYLGRNESNQKVWSLFPAEGVSRYLAAGEEWALDLGVRRKDFEPYVEQGTNGASYQSILEITDSGESLLIHVPVVALPRPVMVAALPGHSEQEGLWVGQAAISKIDAPAYTEELLPTPSPAPVRLLLHVDGYGNIKLLQQALLGWDSTNSTYVLCANESAVGGGISDVKRISSVTFPEMAPLTLRGDSTNDFVLSGTVFGSVTNAYNDPTNPFLHRYHPLHDNKNWDFEPYGEPVETRTIIRDITFEFSQSTTNQADPFWGVDALSGTYKETLFGLRAQPLHVQGGFTLQRISRINTLRITP